MRIAVVLAWAGLAGCGGGPSIPAGCDAYVEPSEDDQTAANLALVEAQSGDTVCFAAGTFTFTDPLEVSRLTDFTLRGAGMGDGGTVLDFSTQTAGGSGVEMLMMTNVVVEDLAIVDSPGNNVRIAQSTGVTIRRVRSGWSTPASPMNGKYAIYPVSSTNVLVEDSEAYASADAGIYVGQSTNCIVRNSVTRGNVAGIEIENSANCEVHGNTAEDNTGGILVFELPGLTEQGMGTLVHDNIVRNNNTPNFAETGSIVALVPTGTGLFVMAAKDVEVRDNTITGNNGTGIAIISWYTQMALTMDPLPAPPYDPQSVTIHVHGNTFMSNGAMPSMTAGDPLNTVSGLLGVSTLEDILWDGFVPMSGGPTDVLCVHDNGTASFRNIDVPGSFGMSTTDATPHDCTFPARPAVQL
ncbi:MAG: right-handed parallel beta-helix repeat-containing protein [Sandaracinaceae bacterium]|nr:right-handed parallel beta-helix repeat-containing protein [Sandaracinaceae bacterium]